MKLSPDFQKWVLIGQVSGFNKCSLLGSRSIAAVHHSTSSFIHKRAWWFHCMHIYTHFTHTGTHTYRGRVRRRSVCCLPITVRVFTRIISTLSGCRTITHTGHTHTHIAVICLTSFITPSHLVWYATFTFTHGHREIPVLKLQVCTHAHALTLEHTHARTHARTLIYGGTHRASLLHIDQMVARWHRWRNIGCRPIRRRGMLRRVQAEFTSFVMLPVEDHSIENIGPSSSQALQ